MSDSCPNEPPSFSPCLAYIIPSRVSQQHQKGTQCCKISWPVKFNGPITDPVNSRHTTDLEKVSNFF